MFRFCAQIRLLVFLVLSFGALATHADPVEDLIAAAISMQTDGVAAATTCMEDNGISADSTAPDEIAAVRKAAQHAVHRAGGSKSRFDAARVELSPKQRRSLRSPTTDAYKAFNDRDLKAKTVQNVLDNVTRFGGDVAGAATALRTCCGTGCDTAGAASTIIMIALSAIIMSFS